MLNMSVNKSEKGEKILHLDSRSEQDLDQDAAVGLRLGYFFYRQPVKLEYN